MKQKTLFFALLALFIACLILFLPIVAIPLTYLDPDWLTLEPAIAQYGYGGDEEDDNGGGPPPPPDQVIPGQGSIVVDPNNPNIFFWFPPGSVSVPVEVRTFYTGLPSNILPPPGGVGTPFFFGAWINGQGTTLNHFDPPIIINVPYDNSISQAPGSSIFESVAELVRTALGQLTGSPLAVVTHPILTVLGTDEFLLSQPAILPPTQEQQLRLNMYNPQTESWVKLCSSVNTYTKRVSGVLASPIPINDGGNTLLAIAVDDTPPLNQVVDAQGKTTISIEGVDTRLQVLPGTVEPGVHFEVTLLPEVPANSPVKLLNNPLDVKACHIDHVVNENSTELTTLPKPLSLEFDYDADTATRAGGSNNVTAVTLQNGQWIDMEEFGYQIIRDQNMIVVDSNALGTFGMAVR